MLMASIDELNADPNHPEWPTVITAYRDACAKENAAARAEEDRRRAEEDRRKAILKAMLGEYRTACGDDMAPLVMADDLYGAIETLGRALGLIAKLDSAQLTDDDRYDLATLDTLHRLFEGTIRRAEGAKHKQGAKNENQ